VIKIPRGKYKRTKKIKEKYSKKKIGKLNPKYINGAYCKQIEINHKMEQARQIKLDILMAKAKRTYLNKEWMFNKYCIEEMPIDKLAEICKVDYEVIWFGLTKLGIPKISIVGRQKWHEYVDQVKNIKPFKYVDFRTP
jgi:hypothetical protein